MSYFDDASLVMIPSGYKTSKVYSVKPTDGTGDLTFTRSNDTATRVGPDGLIEKVRTNLALESQTFQTTWAAVNASVSADDTIAPDGTLTADKLVENSVATSQHRIDQTSVSASGSLTFSLYAKKSERDRIFMRIGLAGATFDLTNGTITSVSAGFIATITDAGNGWYRCTTSTETALSNEILRINLVDAAGAFTYSGDGVSGAFIWGAQYETGDIATDYIATTTAAVSVGPVANVPRLDYLGSSCPRLLLEPQRTNLLTYLEQINDASWSKALSGAGVAPVVTSNYGISPSGYADADRVQFNAGGTTGSDRSLLRKIITLTATQHALSFYVKSNSGTVTLAFTFNGGTVGSITATESEWTRVSYVGTGTGALSTYGIELQGSTTSQTADILFWGAQLEAGAYATSYIPTLGAAVTMGADAASKTGITSLIGQTEGTMFVEFEYQPTGVSQSVAISDGTSSNRIDIRLSTASLLAVIVVSGGVIQVSIGGAVTMTQGQRVKAALAYKNNDFALYQNVVLVASATSGTVGGTLSRYAFDLNGAQFLNSPVNQALLFKTRLSNADLAALTA